MGFLRDGELVKSMPYIFIKLLCHVCMPAGDGEVVARASSDAAKSASGDVS